METFSSQGSNQSLGANKLELVSTNRRSLSEKHQRLEVEPNQKAITATHTKSERGTEGHPSQKAIPRSVSYSLPGREWNTTLAGNNGKYCQAGRSWHYFLLIQPNIHKQSTTKPN